MKVEVKKNVSSSKSAENTSIEDEDSDTFFEDSSSDSKTNDKNPKRKIPQFSVSQSDSVGLRMKISAVHRTDEKNKRRSPNNNNTRNVDKIQNFNSGKRKRKISAASSSSCCSVCSVSESECSSEAIKKEKPKKLRIKRKRVRENVNSEVIHELKCNSASTDSDCGVEQSKVKKSEVDNSQQNKSSTKPTKKDETSETVQKSVTTETLPGSSISSSDTELPALVSAAIKCVESCSENENLSTEPKQYTSTLLRDFMVKTQMLGKSTEIENKKGNLNDVTLPESSRNSMQMRKKRGRPKKSSIIENIVSAVINESADSGVTSITQSLSPSPKNHSNNLGSTKNPIRNAKEQNTEQKRESTPIQKLSIETLDKQMYATERVLYPPRDKKKLPSRQSTKLRNIKEDGEENRNIDPLWKKIDVNMKFRRPSLTGYKSDGGGSTICSKILAARSGYVSDYGSVGTKNYSGYKSDVSGKSRSSMRSCVSRAKSCDYRFGGSRNKKLGRRRRSSISQVKRGNVNEQDILQLAGLSLGQSSEESSRESICKSTLSKKQSKIYGEINRFITTGEYFGSGQQKVTNFSHPGMEANSHTMLDGSEFFSGRVFSKERACSTRSGFFSKEFSKKIRSRRSSAVSRCSSYSAGSRHDSKRKRRRRMRYRLQSRNGYIDSKLNTEIEILINSFLSMCKIADKSTFIKDKDKSDKDKGTGSKTQNKRNQKKKKQNDLTEYHQHHSSNTTLKRRHKKTTHASSDDHKLPLKKRHYLLTPGEKSEGKNGHASDTKTKDAIEGKSSGKNSSVGGKSGQKAVVTPKKRHLLETTNSATEENTSKANHSTTSGDNKPVIKLNDDGSESVPQKSQSHSKGDTLTKKKNRLEGLLTKIQNANSNSKDTFSKSVESVPGYPPPGVFEPTVELEIQIPLVKLTTEGIITKSEVESPQVSDLPDLDKLLPEMKTERVVETLLNKTAANVTLKRKRKKPINRTGFPSLRKKKRKVTTEKTPVISATEDLDSKIIVSQTINIENVKTSEEKLCDRVPHAGETSDTFLERNKQPRLSVVSLERLQEPQMKHEMNDVTKNASSEQQNSFTEPDKIKNNLRNSPSRANNNNGILDQKKIAETLLLSSPATVKKEIEKVRKRAISKNKRTSLRSPKIAKETESRVGNAKSSKSKANVEIKEEMNVSENKPRRLKTENNSTKLRTSKNKTLTDTEEAKPKCKNKLKKENNSTTASSKTDKHHSQSKKCVKNENLTESQVSRSPDNRKEGKSKKEIEFSPIDELEQDPLPPLEENEVVTDSDEIIDESDSTVKGRRTWKWKKNYLSAGLFSDSYKTSRTRKSAGGKANEKDTNDLTENFNPSRSLLPPPPYCERYFRRTIQDFLLPYDLWWAYKNSKLPTKAMVPSWNYKKIRTNVYGDVRPNLVFDRQQCICKTEAGCGDDCLNRMVYTECSPANCPCGDKCTNQKIQKHEISPGVERFMTQNKGWGVRTTLPIKKGTYILEYVGEVVTEKEFKERMATLYANDTHHYCLHLDGGLVIDGHRMGSDGRFVNHSCSPNCEMQKWSVNGLSRMALFALRDIEPDEELTYDYNFSLFNPSEGQLCRCETPQCRGVIGGKSQRVKPLEPKITEITPSNEHSRSRKRQAKKNSGRIQSKDFVVSNLQQPSERERKVIKSKHCFLMRNLEKVRRLKMKSFTKSSIGNTGSSSRPSTPSSLAAQISALRVPRNIQTRVLTQAVCDPEIEKMAKLAAIFREVCTALESVKDEEDKSLILKLLSASKRKQSIQDRTFAKLIDFATVQANVEKGHYKTPEAFDEDVNSVFANAINYFEPGAEETLIVKRLSKEYTEKKTELYSRLVELIGEKCSKSFRIGGKATGVYNTHEDVIRCICGLFKDEGLMIQCSKCLVWQHTECTKANVNEENYLCERCEPRKVDLEIPLEEFTEENYRYYLSLLRGELQIRQGDTVYVLRDIPIKDEDGNVLETKKHTYETIGKIDYSECDIFRVERLWKDNDGKRFIFGHHYLRPHETFHEPSRKFYENEVVRVPLYEVIPIELVIARCWVFDRKTFCMGRPVDCTSEDHVYICELRVNKSARLFAKNKQSYPICTKNYAFRRFKEKLHISRTYAPHDVDPALVKKKRKTNDASSTSSSSQHHNQQQQQQQHSKKSTGPVVQLMPPPPKTINEKRNRLENILKDLRIKQDIQPDATPPLDLSYLLTGRGARQRRANATIVPL